MPGLKPEEELNWDKRNLTAQLFIVIENIRLLKDYLDNSTNTLDTHLRGILKNLSGRQKNLSVTSPKDIFEFQKDLGALILLTENGFDFKKYIGNTTDLYTVAQEFLRQTGTCTDIAIQFPKMVQNAITAIQTDGHKPPAEEMQKAQDYFASRVVVAIGETETQPLTNEEELYFKAVDDARHRVENKLNRQEIDRSQVDDLDIEIDAIMESKESFVEKINKLKLIAQN